MSTSVLGIHNGHNASAAVIEDGILAFALQEERLSRIKNHGGLPAQALVACAGFLGSGDDGNIAAALGGHNLTRCDWRRDDILRSYGLRSPGVVGRAKRIARKNGLISNSVNRIKITGIEEELRALLAKPQLRASSFDHHLCHAAAAYFGWGKMDERVLLLTCDGAGDSVCATVNVGEGGRIERLASVEESHSIGALYGKVTYLLGMVPMEHEYKLMGLAPYAEKSREAQRIAADFEQIFEFDPHNPMLWRRTNGCPPLQFAAEYLAERLLRKRFDHVAGGIQLFVERFLVRWVQACVAATGIRKLALSGGVFMNVKANQKILELPEVEEMFVFPSCGDETNAMGAAWLLSREGRGNIPEPLKHLYLGPEYSESESEAALRGYQFREPVQIREEADVEHAVALLLSQGRIVARFKGRGEFGARALGNRSILANASQPEAVKTINEMIKCRDFWMPFAPSVLAERSDDYFEKPKPMPAPYMIMTFDTRPEKRAAISAAIHPCDHTGRPQEVSEDSNADYYRLLKYYEEITGEGLILNTSFNLHGEPVVCTPEDALRVFDLSGLEHLALGNFLLSKPQPSGYRPASQPAALSHSL